MASLKSLPILLIGPALAGCQFTASAGGLDYEKLQDAITAELNGSYSGISRQVSSVDCPRQSETPKTGDTFVCTASVDSEKVRVEVTVKDDDYNVDFTTLDALFDLPGTADGLTGQITEQLGFPVTVTCGEGLKAVEIGTTFECTAADEDGDTRTVQVTAGAVGESDSWELVE